MNLKTNESFDILCSGSADNLMLQFTLVGCDEDTWIAHDLTKPSQM